MVVWCFALDSWWDERRDRDNERITLHALHDEFTTNREVVVKYRQMNLDGIESLEAFLGAFEAGIRTSNKRTPDEASRYLLVVPTPDVGAGVLNALINSGRIELLQSANLRNLVLYAPTDGYVQDDLLPSKGFAYDTVIPFVISKGLPVSSAFESLDIPFNADLPERSLKNDPDAHRALMNDISEDTWSIPDRELEAACKCHRPIPCFWTIVNRQDRTTRLEREFQCVFDTC